MTTEQTQTQAAPEQISLDAVGGVFQQLEGFARDLAIRKAAELRVAVDRGNALVGQVSALNRTIEELRAELVLRDAEIGRLQSLVSPEPPAE